MTGILPNKSGKRSVKKPSNTQSGQGNGILPGANRRSVRQGAAASTITVIAGDVSNPTTSVLTFEAGTGATLSATQDGKDTTVTISAEKGEPGPAGADAHVTIYSATARYALNDLVRASANSPIVYISNSDDNIGNPLTDNDNWSEIAASINTDNTMVNNDEIYGVDTDIIADTDWVRAEGVHTSRYFKVEDTTDDNASQATGEDAVAIGPDTNASGQFSMAIGNTTTATNNGALGIGNASNATGIRSVAMGDRANATDTDTLAMGDNATASAKEDVSIGSNTVASGERSVAMGSYVTASGVEAVAIGAAKGIDHEDRTIASGPNSIAIGSGAEASGVDATAIGEDAEASDTDAIAIGDGANATAENAIALGAADATGTDSIAIGKDASAGGTNSIALGNGASTSTDNKMEIAGINNIQITNFHGDDDQYIVVNSSGTWELRDLPQGHDTNAGYVGKIGYGLDTESDILKVDTEVIADTEWVKDYVTDNAAVTAGFGLNKSGIELSVDTDEILSVADAKDTYAVKARYDTDTNGDTHIVTVATGQDVVIEAHNNFIVKTGDNDNELFQIDAEHNWHVDNFKVFDAGNMQFAASTVDTDVIADTEWVKDYVEVHGGDTLTFDDERADTEWTGTKFICDDDTGLRFTRDADGSIRMSKYVATPDFAVSISNAQGNRSWFNTSTTDTATVTATEGTITSITSATVNNSNTDVTINNGHNTVTYPVTNSNGLYELRVNVSGTNDDDVSQTASANHSWRVYADYWLATNQTSSSAAFSTTAGRVADRFQTGDITAVGHTFLTVSASEFSGTFSFRTALGNLTVQAPTTFDISINSITKSYKRYYLGNFSNSTTITVSGG